MSTLAKVLEPSSGNLEMCADLLRRGEVVALPTETVYGLGGNALEESSARKIFEVKGRPLIDPLIVHFKDFASALPYVYANPVLERLAKAFWPGPLTVVIPKRDNIPDMVTAGLPSVAIRVPGHPVFRKLLALLDFPLAAPSANPFGYVSPTLADHVLQTLGARIPAILDGGSCEYGVESTIIDLREAAMPRILRQGPISHAALEPIIGMDVSLAASSGAEDTAQAAPGLLTKHYSPRTKIDLVAHGSMGALLEKTDVGSTQAYVCNQRPGINKKECPLYWLSEAGDQNEAAHNLFALIQQLDRQEYSRLIVELAPEEGIGCAINDRLKRAAAKV